jgi:hypothetical protein
LHLSSLPWFVWIVVPLLPLGAVAYIFKFYRKHLGSLIVWTRAAILVLIQTAFFLLSFAFFPRLAFFIIVVALPFEYHLFDKNLKHHGIERSIEGKVF